jgi:uncharacterized protein YlaI
MKNQHIRDFSCDECNISKLENELKPIFKTINYSEIVYYICEECHKKYSKDN